MSILIKTILFNDLIIDTHIYIFFNINNFQSKYTSTSPLSNLSEKYHTSLDYSR